MKKIIVIALVAALAIPFAGLTSVASAEDSGAIQPNFSNKTLKGTYTFLSDANDEGFSPSVGTFSFDGTGGMTAVININNDGDICAGMTLTGTYIVNSTRTATANLTLTSVNTANCADQGNNDILNLSLAFGPKTATTAVQFINFVEMDPYAAGTFADTFDAFAGVATYR